MIFLNETLDQIQISEYNNYVKNYINTLKYQYNYDLSLKEISKDELTKKLIGILSKFVNTIYQKTIGENINSNDIGSIKNIDRNYLQNLYGQYFVPMTVISPINNEQQKIYITIPNRPVIEHYEYGNGSKITRIITEKESEASIKRAAKKISKEIELIGFNIINSIKFYINVKSDKRYYETPEYSVYIIYELAPEYNDIKDGFIDKYGDYPEYGEMEWEEQYGLNEVLLDWNNSKDNIQNNNIIKSSDIKWQMQDPIELWHKYSKDIETKYNNLGITDQGEISFLLYPDNNEILYRESDQLDYDWGYLYIDDNIKILSELYKNGFQLNFTINWDNYRPKRKLITFIKKFLKSQKKKKFPAPLKFFNDIDESVMCWIGITAENPGNLYIQEILDIYYNFLLSWLDYLKTNLEWINTNLNNIEEES